MVIKEGVALASVGAVIGIGVALGITRFLGSLLYKVRAADPLTFVGVAVLLAAVAALACYLPTRRATRVDPLVALRYEQLIVPAGRQRRMKMVSRCRSVCAAAMVTEVDLLWRWLEPAYEYDWDAEKHNE